jgi:methylmalonyl-CoA mutase cobalamin-binding domain/chain
MSLSETRTKALQEGLQQAIDGADTTLGIQTAQAALAEGASPLEFFQGVVEPVLTDIGDRFARLEIFLPELMKAGLVVKAVQQQVLEPAIRNSSAESSSLGTVVIGTCQGDIHDIGKNMVALMLQVNGFKVVDLGTNVSPRGFIDAARREEADIIALSSLLTPSMPYIKDVINLLNGFGLRERFLVVAGGAPVTREWAQTVGADGFGEDAVEAVDVCRKLMAERRRKTA